MNLQFIDDPESHCKIFTQRLYGSHSIAFCSSYTRQQQFNGDKIVLKSFSRRNTFKC